jgi:uncharacterized RDD family membrane protein YckC
VNSENEVHSEPQSSLQDNIDKSHAEPMKICQGCRAVNKSESQYCYKCGLKLADDVSAADQESAVPVGFWTRFASFLIDSIILSVGSSILTLVLVAILFTIFPDLAGNYAVDEYTWDAILTASDRSATWLDWAIYVFFVVFGFAYWTVSIGWKGQTLGKSMLGLKVVKSSGGKVSYLSAFIRTLGYILGFATLGIGFLVIAWNSRKRGLHDFLAGTKVIKK